jgi:hypothetical protein
VHQIGPSFQPQSPDAEPTQLVVYRRRDNRVRFMEVNSITMALLQALDGDISGDEALDRLAAKVPHLDHVVVRDGGLATLLRFRQAEIILGAKRAHRV